MCLMFLSGHKVFYLLLTTLFSCQLLDISLTFFFWVKLLYLWFFEYAATDIVRMLVLHPHGASLLIKHVEKDNNGNHLSRETMDSQHELKCQLMFFINWYFSVTIIRSDLLLDVIKKVTEDSALPANLLTTVRVLVNLFKNSSFHYWLQTNHSQVSTISFLWFYIIVRTCDDLLSIAELRLGLDLKFLITFYHSAYTCVFECFIMIIWRCGFSGT